MDSQNFAGFPMEDELQAAGSVAADLAARDFAIVRHSDFVRNILVGELFLGLADERNLRDRVDPVGIIGRIGMHRRSEGPRRGNAALLHRYGSEAREADHIADSVYIGLRRTEIAIYLNAAA